MQVPRLDFSTSLSRSRGTSLVGALIALVLFGFVLTQLTTLMVNTIATNALAQRMEVATQLAAQKVEALRAMDYETLSSSVSDEAALTPSGTQDDGIYTRSWTVIEDASIAAGAKWVIVTVTWTDKLGEHRVELPTIITG